MGFLGKIRGQNSNDVTSFFVQQEKERHADGDGATAVNYSKKCFHCVFHYLDLIPIKNKRVFRTPIKACEHL